MPRARVVAVPTPYAPSPPWRALPRPSSAPQPASPSRRQARHRQPRATPWPDGAPRAPLAARSLRPTRRDAVGHGQRLRWPHAPTRGTTRCGSRGAPQGRPCARSGRASRPLRANRRRSRLRRGGAWRDLLRAACHRESRGLRGCEQRCCRRTVTVFVTRYARCYAEGLRRTFTPPRPRCHPRIIGTTPTTKRSASLMRHTSAAVR